MVTELSWGSLHNVYRNRYQITVCTHETNRIFYIDCMSLKRKKELLDCLFQVFFIKI